MNGRDYVPSLVPWMVAVALLSTGSRVGLEYTITGGVRSVLLGASVAAVWWAAHSIRSTRVRISPPDVILPAGIALAVAAAHSLVRTTAGPVTLFWPAISVGAAVSLTVGVWLLLERWRPAVTARTGRAGGVLLFGQLLDASTTMVGIDIIGFSERVTLSRMLIDATASLPVAPVFGTTWLFALSKLGLAVAIVVWTGTPRDLTPFERQTVLATATATGVVPAVNNLVLQSLS